MSKFLDFMEAYARSDLDDERKVIEKEVWDSYGREGAVCVIDMSGFSRLTEMHGIVHYLSMVRHMQIVVEPIVKRFGGRVIKFEADNCFALYPEVLPAIRASVGMNIAFDAMNLMTTDDLNIYISTGIDYGRILHVVEEDRPEEEDFYGAAVNTASKLGEDIADAGQILVTKAAMDRVPEGAGFKTEPETFEISKITIEARRVIY